MSIKKLTSADAFVAVDLDGAPSAGVVRCAPKILQGGAKDLARSLTYSFALFEMQRGGASAGINAKPDQRAQAIDAFVEELTPAVGRDELSLWAAKGVSDEELGELTAADHRSSIAAGPHEGDDLATHLAGLGPVVAAAYAVGGLDGKRVAIEGFGAHGAALAQAAAAAGATVVAVSTAKGCMANTAGLDPAELRSGWAADGDALVGTEASAASDVFGVDTDVLFTGSKMGAVNHVHAAEITAAVVPHAPLSYTARALAVMTAAELTVVPDFLSTAAPLFAWWPNGDSSASEVVATASAALTQALDDTAGHNDGAFLGACARAEAFLGTWRDELPFGRPLAS